MQSESVVLNDNVLEEISKQLLEATDGAVSITDENVTFSDLGVTSVNILSLLVALENAFGIEWSVDTPPEVFKSPASLSSYIHEQLGN